MYKILCIENFYMIHENVTSQNRFFSLANEHDCKHMHMASCPQELPLMVNMKHVHPQIYALSFWVLYTSAFSLISFSLPTMAQKWYKLIQRRRRHLGSTHFAELNVHIYIYMVTNIAEEFQKNSKYLGGMTSSIGKCIWYCINTNTYRLSVFTYLTFTNIID